LRPWAAVVLPGAVALTVLASGSCNTDESAGGSTMVCATSGDLHCTRDGDCPLREICSIGLCVLGCRTGGDRCPDGETCANMRCVASIADAGPDSSSDGSAGDADGSGTDCPADMVALPDSHCMDQYESSRPNATDIWVGDDESLATSRPDVLPWFPVTKPTAAAACAAAGKRLCTPDELTAACSGPSGRRYVYGNDYAPATCNGSDTFCSCGAGSACEGTVPCPYPGCFHLPPEGQTAPSAGCGAQLHVLPTGSLPGCVSPEGAFDLSGNVWELVDDGSEEGQFRAGAFNCIDSLTLHQCAHVGVGISAKGFRCCR
jgi:hypothetical protein